MSGVNAHAIIKAVTEPITDGVGPAASSVQWRCTMRCYREVLMPQHPMLYRAAQPGKQRLQLYVDLNSPSMAFMWDHQVNGGAILPGAGYLEMGAAAAGLLCKMHGAMPALSGATIVAPLPLGTTGSSIILAAEIVPLLAEVTISSNVNGAAGASTHLKAGVVNVPSYTLKQHAELFDRDIESIVSAEIVRAACREPQATAAVYEELNQAGLQYGKQFRYVYLTIECILLIRGLIT